MVDAEDRLLVERGVNHFIERPGTLEIATERLLDDHPPPRLRLVSNLSGTLATPGEITSAGYWRRHVREADARQHDAVTSLSALLDAVFVSPEENRDFYLVYLDLIQNSVRHSTFSGLAEVVRAHINGSYAVVIAAGVESGEFQVADVASAAREARSLVDGHVVQWLQRDDWRESHLLLHDDCLDSLRRLLRYEEAPQI